jgi:hypothetical protein
MSSESPKWSEFSLSPSDFLNQIRDEKDERQRESDENSINDFALLQRK